MSVLEQMQLALMQVNQAHFEFFNPPTYPVASLPYAQEYGAGARYIPPNLDVNALTTYTGIRVSRTRNFIAGAVVGVAAGVAVAAFIRRKRK